MPDCGSQIILCDVPIRFDTYKGCSHGCKYCFVYRKYNISKIKKFEGKEALLSFIKGNRSQETSWCDWPIPLHWGGVSDPFQHIERKVKNSLECLKVFAETKYPFIVSTKSILPQEEPYYSLFKKCNCVFQVSLVCKTLQEKFEINTPTFDERLKFIKKMSKAVKRLVVRCQPYIIDYHKEIRENIKKYAQAGVYGVIFEAIKFQKSNKNLVQIGADFCYPNEILKNKFLDLKEECHKYGLKFLSGENRFRNMGDSLSCCGFEGLEGFEGNKYNLNYKIYKQEDLKVTESMKNKGSAYCFKAMHQKAGSHKLWKSLTYKQVMDSVFCNKSCVHSYLGVENGKRKKFKTI